MTGGGSGIGFEITRQLGKPTGSSDGKALPSLFIRTYLIFFTLSPCSLQSSANAAALDLPATHVAPPWCLPLCHALSLLLIPSCLSPYLTGLHGAAVAITGRRQPVLDSAVEALSSEDIHAVGLQVQNTL